MVIKDPFANEMLYVKKEGTSPFLAPPSDRLLASFLDFLFHIPFFSFASFIILYRLNLLKLTIATSTELMAVMAQLAWIFILGSIILNSIYIKFWKKTPGMRIMKLELRALNQQALSWEQCLIRSTIWAAEILMLGIPLLAILSHPKRHAFHDRISETEMVSLKAVGSLSPLPMEKALVSVVVLSIIMLGLGWMTAFFSITQKGIQNGTFALSEWREQGQLCSQVDEISTYSNVNLNPFLVRLDFGIALFFLEQIDHRCLDKELEFAFFKKMESPLVWVGRALLSSPHTEERNAYVKKACELDSRWCMKSLFHEKADLSEVNELLRMEKETPKKEGALLSYLSSKLILFNKIGASDVSQKLLQQLQEQGIRATGLVAEHLKVIAREQPEGLTTALNTLRSVMVEKDFLKLNSEMCLRQLEVGCSSKIKECETMVSLIPQYKEESFSDFMVSRAFFKDSVCRQNLSENIEYWTLTNNKSLQSLIQLAMEADHMTTRSQALARLRHFVKNEAESEELRFDALQILMSYSHFAPDWLLVSELWNQLHWNQSIYLSASAWMMREAKKKSQNNLILSMENMASKIPGLKLDWNLLQSGQKSHLLNQRVPASEKGP